MVLFLFFQHGQKDGKERLVERKKKKREEEESILTVEGHLVNRRVAKDVEVSGNLRDSRLIKDAHADSVDENRVQVRDKKLVEEVDYEKGQITADKD